MAHQPQRSATTARPALMRRVLLAIVLPSATAERCLAVYCSGWTGGLPGSQLNGRYVPDENCCDELPAVAALAFILHGPAIIFASTLHRPVAALVSILHGPAIIFASTLHRPVAALVSILHGPAIICASAVRVFAAIVADDAAPAVGAPAQPRWWRRRRWRARARATRRTRASSPAGRIANTSTQWEITGWRTSTCLARAPAPSCRGNIGRSATRPRMAALRLQRCSRTTDPTTSPRRRPTPRT